MPTATAPKPTTPPKDTNGELRRANLALERCRRELTEKSKLPLEWQHWVAQSLAEGLLPVDDEAGAA